MAGSTELLASVQNISKELADLQHLIEFPEEIASILTEQEQQLYCQMFPCGYIHFFTNDVRESQHSHSSLKPCLSDSDAMKSIDYTNIVQKLTTRFSEVSSWVTCMILSASSIEERRDVFSYLICAAKCCWNMGNYNGVVEFLVGLNRSCTELKIWQILDQSDIRTMCHLKDSIAQHESSPDYRKALIRALNISGYKVVPFCGVFLRKLKDALGGTTNLISLYPCLQSQEYLIEFITEYNNQDCLLHQTGEIEQVRSERETTVSNILKTIHNMETQNGVESSSKNNCSCQKLCKDGKQNIKRDLSDSEGDVLELVNEPECHEVDKILKPFSHGIELIPWYVLSIRADVHQFLLQGATVIHYDQDSRLSAHCFLKLQPDNCFLTWVKLKSSCPSSVKIKNLVQGSNSETNCGRPQFIGHGVHNGLTDGFLDMFVAKAVFMGHPGVDIQALLLQNKLCALNPEESVITLLHGLHATDNKLLHFVAPKHTAKVLFHGLVELVHAVRRMKKFPDQKLQWLRRQYVSLYQEDAKYEGPTLAQAIELFGGRRWNMGMTNPEKPNSQRNINLVLNTKKKKKLLVPDYNGEGKDDEMVTGKIRNCKSTWVRTSLKSCDIMDQNFAHSTIPAQLHPYPVYTMKTKVQTSNRTSQEVQSCRNGCLKSFQNFMTSNSIMTFFDFVELFKSFSTRSRKDLKDIFDAYAVPYTTSAEESAPLYSNLNIDDKINGIQPDLDLLSRNKFDLGLSIRSWHHILDNKKQISDAIAAASIMNNGTGVESATLGKLGMTIHQLNDFLVNCQGEHYTYDETLSIIQAHDTSGWLSSKAWRPRPTPLQAC
ncbi:1-phosphatidylinositol 4,5-bisphosphate phosphodiesterase epsilon-1 isoform X3 [Arapaima gigas]